MSEAFTPIFDAAYSLAAVCCFTAVGRVFVASAFALAADLCAIVASAFAPVADLRAYVASALTFTADSCALIASACVSTADSCAVVAPALTFTANSCALVASFCVSVADSCALVASALSFTADPCASVASVFAFTGACSFTAACSADLRAFVASAFAFAFTDVTCVGDFELHAVSLLIDFGLCTAGCAVGLGAGSCVVSCSVVGLGPCTISLGSCAVGLGFGLCAVGLGLCAVGLGLCGAVGLCASTVDCAVAFSLGHTVAIDVGWAVTVAVGCAESCIFVTSACAFTIAVPMLTGDCSSAPTFADGCASAAARSALAPTLDAQLGARCPWRIGARAQLGA